MKRKISFIIALIITACNTTTGTQEVMISLNKATLTLDIGQEEKLITSFYNKNTSTKSIVWLSSDISKVTVDNNGNVKGISFTTDPVNVTVTIITQDNAIFTATCVIIVGNITINLPVEMTGVFEKLEGGPFLIQGKSINLTAKVNGIDNQNVYWEIIDKDVQTGTKIENGELSIASNELHGKALTIKSTSDEANITGNIILKIVSIMPSDYFGIWKAHSSDYLGDFEWTYSISSESININFVDFTDSNSNEIWNVSHLSWNPVINSTFETKDIYPFGFRFSGIWDGNIFINPMFFINKFDNTEAVTEEWIVPYNKL